MKKLAPIVLSVVLLISSVVQEFFFVKEVSAESPKFHILEIVDSGASKLTLLDNRFQVTKLEMKEFVAERKDIDGLYDAIYIGEGVYHPGLPTLDPDPFSKDPSRINLLTNSNRQASHNTSNVMNDITKLKADEILNNYVYKGLPLVLHSSIQNQPSEPRKQSGKEAILRTTFFKPEIVSLPNVFVIDNVSRFPVDKMVVTKPKINTIVYSTTNGQAAKFNSEVQLKFNLLNGNPEDITANFYIDLDYNNQFTQEEALYSRPLSRLGNQTDGYTISYRLPKGYSGPRFWKVELVDKVGRKEIQTGSFHFQGEKVEIDVLQVLPDNSSGNLVNVLNLIPEKKSNVIETNEFKITIDTIKISDFIKPDSTNNKSFLRINDGRYNMIVFGFKDQYGDQNISTQSAKAVREFVETGQSLFLTHDTFRRDRSTSNNDLLLPSNNWLKNLFDLSGQDYEINAVNKSATLEEKLNDPGKFYLEQNFGRGGVATTTSTRKVNSGLMTEYPYKLNHSVSIASTHSQYFAINLENPNVIPWYNLTSSHRDNEDSWNHYYVYSYNNVTYSGAGHTTNNFTAEEQKLFVNTLYRAFLSANHQPDVAIIEPKIDQKVPSYQDVNITYQIEDLDLVDRYLNTKLYVNNQLVLENNNIPSGSILSHIYQHGLEQDGSIDVRIEVSDKKGAKRVRSQTIAVEGVKADFQLTRQISDSLIKVGSPYKIQYTVNPKELQLTEQQLDTRYIKPIALFDSEIDKKKIGNRVTLFESTDLVNADAISFRGAQSARELGDRVANGIRQDIGSDSITLSELKSKSYSIVNGKNVGPLVHGFDQIGEYETFYLPVIDTSNKITKMAVFTGLEYNGRNGTNAVITAKFMGFFNDFNNKIQLRFSEEFPKGISVGAIRGLNNISIKEKDGITIVEGDIPEIVLTVGLNGKYISQPVQFEITITPIQPGAFDLTSSKVIDKGDITKQYNFPNLRFMAKEGLQSVTVPEKILLFVGGDSHRVPITYDPFTVQEDGIIKEIRWQLLDPNVATLNQGILTGITEGNTKLLIQVEDVFGTVIPSRNEWLIVDIEVINPVINISSPDKVELYVGESASLQVGVQPESARSSLVWQVENDHIARMQENNKTVQGLQAGETNITVIGRNRLGEMVSKTIRVIVKQKVTNLTLNPNEIVLNLGESYNLDHVKVDIFPQDATNKNYQWIKDSNSIIEFIDNRFTAVNPGSSTIKIISDDRNAESSLNVRVKAPLQGIMFNPATIEVKKGSRVKLSSYLKKVPANTTSSIEVLGYKVDKESFASITDFDHLDAKRIGTVMVSVEVKAESSSYTAEMKVKIVDKNGKSDDDLY